MSSYNSNYSYPTFTRIGELDAKINRKKANKDIGKEKLLEDDINPNDRYDRFLKVLEDLKNNSRENTSTIAQSIENSGTTDDFWDNLKRTTMSSPTNNRLSTSTTTTIINNNNYDPHFLDWIKSWEGGYSDIDGGTNRGVRTDTWRSLGYAKDYNNDGKTDRDDLKNMTDKDWLKVVDHFKDKVRFSEIKDKNVAQLMFLFAWGSGIDGGIRLAREILGLPKGTKIDDQMLDRLNQNTRETFEILKEGRRRFLDKISNRPDKQQYKNGWMRRLDSMHYDKPWELNS